ncbi:unnamed protein product [Effrenium voratum]|nr:unnamed protein product [Effrenium voratum]
MFISAQRWSSVRIKPRIKGGVIPFHQRIRQEETERRYRQLPFLSISKEPSKWPSPPDPRDTDRRLCKLDLAQLMNIMVGDRVRVLYGSEKGKYGVISRILRDKNQVIVNGVSLKRGFWHPEPGPGKPNLVTVECPIHVTNVTLVDPVTKQPTRVKRRYTMNGEGVRISKVSGCAMPEPVPVGPNERELLWKKHEEQVLRQAKERRGPPKEDIFGNKEHFKTLVRLVRERRQAEEAKAGWSALLRTSGACPICWEENLRSQDCSQAVCGHRFCTPCIEQWAERCSCCPLCKQEMGVLLRQRRGLQGLRGWKRRVVEPKKLEMPAEDAEAKGPGLDGDKSHNITAVDVSGNDLGEEGGAKVLELFMQNQLVRRLAMNSNELGEMRPPPCAPKCWQPTPPLKSWTLQGNSIFIDGVKLLAEALQKNRTLQRLDLSHNQLGIYGAELVASGLAQSSLAYLNISGNRVCGRGAEQLLMASKDTGLRHLDLAMNEIGPQNLDLILAPLASSSLNSINLGSNRIDGEGAQQICTALKENSRLEVLMLQQNDLGPDGAAHVAESCWVPAPSPAWTWQATALATRAPRASQRCWSGASSLAWALATTPSLTRVPSSWPQLCRQIWSPYSSPAMPSAMKGPWSSSPRWRKGWFST